MLEKQLKNKQSKSRKRRSDSNTSQKNGSKHIRFDNSRHDQTAMRPECKVEVFSSSSCYVADVACNSSSRLVAAGLSNSRLHIYQVQAAQLRLESGQREHDGPVTAIQFPPSEPQMLFSSGADGAVLGWDLRTRTRTHRYRTDGTEIFSFDVSTSHNLVAAGVKGAVLFWDLRKSGGTKEATLHNFADTHEDDVTQVAFHPDRSDHFLSASEDGLISVFNFSNGISEEESFEGAVNLMDSIASLGFYGNDKELLWCRTATESLHLWEWAAACSEDAPGGGGPLGSLKDARKDLSLAASRPAAGRVEYLLDCTYDAAADQLLVLGGSGRGEVVSCPVSCSGSSCQFSPPRMTLSGGHNAVGDVSWLNRNSMLLAFTIARRVSVDEKAALVTDLSGARRAKRRMSADFAISSCGMGRTTSRQTEWKAQCVRNITSKNTLEAGESSALHAIQVVRCHAFPQESNIRCITGGEDGRIITWVTS